MGPETDVGSELPLTLFDATYPGLAAARVGLFWQPTSHPDVTETETEQERDCLKLLISTHFVVQIWTFLCKRMGFEQLHERGLFCTEKQQLCFSSYLQPLNLYSLFQY